MTMMTSEILWLHTSSDTPEDDEQVLIVIDSKYEIIEYCKKKWWRITPEGYNVEVDEVEVWGRILPRLNKNPCPLEDI